MTYLVSNTSERKDRQKHQWPGQPQETSAAPPFSAPSGRKERSTLQGNPVGELLGSELGCPLNLYQVPGHCDWWAALDTPYSKDQGCAYQVLPGGNQGGNLLSKERFCPYNCREFLLPCVSLAVTLCVKRLQQGKRGLSQFEGHQHRDQLDCHKQPLQHWEPEKSWAGVCTEAAPPVSVQCWHGTVAPVVSCLLPGLKSWPKATLQNWAL